jgi:hypothetical protein
MDPAPRPGAVLVRVPGDVKESPAGHAALRNGMKAVPPQLSSTRPLT